MSGSTMVRAFGGAAVTDVHLLASVIAIDEGNPNLSRRA